MMAASCRNLTFSSSGDSGFNVLMATFTGPSGECHTPLSTHPNCPEPSLVVVLQTKQMKRSCTIINYYNFYTVFGQLLSL